MDEQDRPIVGNRVFLLVWGGLVLLTLLTVAVSRWRILAGWSPAGSLLIASAKAGLILLFFMDLRREPAFFRVAIGAAVLAMALILGLTFADVLFRG